MRVREPVFGHRGWYPTDEQSCASSLDNWRGSFAGVGGRMLAGVVPHAGWAYSGELAMWSFAGLALAAPELVFLFGGHMRRQDRPVCMTTGSWGTPLGPVRVAADVAGRLADEFGCVVETPERFTPENTLELQMPMLKATWPEAEVVAVQVPPTVAADEIGRWAAEVAREKGIRAVAIGSTDLTHYGSSYGFAPHGLGEEAHRWSKDDNDRPFLDHVLALDGQAAVDHALANHSACCPGAVHAAVAFAREKGAKDGELVAHTTSHEVRGFGVPQMWVGYASLIF